MKLLFTVKQLGKRKALLTKKAFEFPLAPNQNYSLLEVLEAIIIQQVNAFNEKREAQLLAHLLEDSQISTSEEQTKLLDEEALEAQANSGKLSFGDIENTKLADKQKAIVTMQEAFADGLIGIFHNGEQLEKANQNIYLKEEDEFIFVRLTFLAGSMY